MLKKLGRIAVVTYVALALAPLVFIALFSTFQFLTEQLGPWRASNDTVLAPERASDLAKKGLIQQVVSLREVPIGLRKDPKTDTYDLYAIGVGQTTLDEPQKTVGLFGDSAPKSNLAYADTEPVVGNYNNILIFDPKSASSTMVFSSRVAVLSFRYAAGPEFETLVIFATDRDTDKDGRLSEFDEADVYLYAIPARTLSKVTGLKGKPITVETFAQQTYVVVRTVHDANSDGLFVDFAYKDAPPDPSLLFRVDIATATATPLVPAETVNEMQRLLSAGAPAK